MLKPVPVPNVSPWKSQVWVIRALFQREITTRFGEYKLGFLWMLLEPVLSVVVIGLLVGHIAGRAVPEIPYAYFVLNGKLLLNLFTGPIYSSLSALRSNQGLLVYPNVRALDPYLARFVYELITTFFSFVVFCIVGAWMDIQVSLQDLDILAACYLITWLMGCGLGLISAVAVAHYSEFDKVIEVILSPLMFISAVMFPMSGLPSNLRGVLMYNPLVHPIELSRNALFPHYYAQGANLYYPAALAIVFLALGLRLFQNNIRLMNSNE